MLCGWIKSENLCEINLRPFTKFFQISTLTQYDNQVNRILVAGAGGAPSEGVIFSLMKNPNFEVIGMGADIADLVSSQAHKKRFIPYATDENYETSLRKILLEIKPDFIHFQNDSEIYIASQLRHIFDEFGVKYFLPSHEVIDKCVHKFKSYLAFSNAGIIVPKNVQITNESDLRESLKVLGGTEGRIWLRSSTIGGGGKGSVATSDFDFAKSWITANNGWGTFLAAEILSEKTVTWQSIWHKGELVVAQTRRRSGWIHGNRTISGITGVTKVGITDSDELVDKIAIQAVKSVDENPNGLYGVDMTYDSNGIPNPTEINIARFFTTIRFFTEAGLNMPEIYAKIGLGLESKSLATKLNPLPNNLLWLRGMDRKPRLITVEELNQFEVKTK